MTNAVPREAVYNTARLRSCRTRKPVCSATAVPIKNQGTYKIHHHGGLWRFT